jgi:hypothetical protein
MSNGAGPVIKSVLDVPNIENVASGKATMVIHVLSTTDHIYQFPGGKIARVTRIAEGWGRLYERWLSRTSAATHHFPETTLWRVGDTMYAKQPDVSMTVPVRIVHIGFRRLLHVTEDDAENCGFDPVQCPVCADVSGTIHDLGGCPVCGGSGVMETALDVFTRSWDASHPTGQKLADDIDVVIIGFDRLSDMRESA